MQLNSVLGQHQPAVRVLAPISTVIPSTAVPVMQRHVLDNSLAVAREFVLISQLR
jgi:hypothetical protein